MLFRSSSPVQASFPGIGKSRGFGTDVNMPRMGCLAKVIQQGLDNPMSVWEHQYPDFDAMMAAGMICVVNGPLLCELDASD